MKIVVIMKLFEQSFALVFLTLVLAVHCEELFDNEIDVDDREPEPNIKPVYADHTIPPLSSKMTAFINSINTTWKVMQNILL